MIVERTSMGKAMKREHDPDWREGRKLKGIDNEQFEKLAQKQKDGIITVADCCRELGISRSTSPSTTQTCSVLIAKLSVKAAFVLALV